MRCCPNGHEMTPANTYVRPSRPSRPECRICKSASHLRWERSLRPRRYEVGPLLAACGMTIGQFGRRHGISGTTRASAARSGLTVPTADHWAVLAGFHPCEIWPSWFDDALVDAAKAKERRKAKRRKRTVEPMARKAAA